MRTYDDDEDDYEVSEREGLLHRSYLPDEHLGWVDGLLALALAAFVGVGLLVWAFPGLSPLAWKDAAIATGLRPPADVFPGLWRVLAKALCTLGVPTEILRLAGCACAALTAGASYLLLRCAVGLLVRGRLRTARLRTVVQRVAAFVGALLFACADPVWRCGHAFDPSGFLMLLMLVALAFFAGFLLNGRLISAYAAMFCFGLLGAETPLGFVLLLLAWFVYGFALRRDALGETMPLLDPLTGPTAKWCLTFFWGVGLVAGIVVNCWSFDALGGLAAIGAKGGDLVLLYLTRWGDQIATCASVLGAVLALGVCVMPFLVTAVLLPDAVDEERFLPYHVGAVFFFAGVLCLAQLAMVGALHFWNWSASASVPCLHLLQFCLLLAAATVAFALTVLGCDTCCRDHRRLANLIRAEEQEPATVAPVKGGRTLGFVLFLLVGVLMVASSVPGVRMTTVRTMQTIVEDFLVETVRESGDAQVVFTDGACDARLELLAREQKKNLVALPVETGDAPYAQTLRMRAARDAEDRAAFRDGTAGVLRGWVKTRPARLSTIAVQRGFELWRREALALPACSGVLMRPTGQADAERARGIAVATNLAARVLAFYAAGGRPDAADPQTRNAFLAVQWRLARLARLRAEAADAARDTATSAREQKLANDLDAANGALQQALAESEFLRTRALQQLTPREGLQLALVRADFALAARYAAPVLESDPENADALFGLGMNFYEQGQYARAEEKLALCLKQKPNEPAVWNNLAMAQLKAGKLAEASASVEKARALAPSSAEVADTARQIRAAQAKPAAKK